MSEPIKIERLVDTVEVRVYCDVCKDTELRSNSFVNPVNPPRYAHICPKCNKKFNLDVLYPCIEYRNNNSIKMTHVKSD